MRTRCQDPTIPGLRRGWFCLAAELVADVVGGSLAGTGRVVETYRIQIAPQSRSFSLAVRDRDGQGNSLAIMNRRVQQETTFDDSGRYARALARLWHLEAYRFDRWRTAGGVGGRRPVYRYTGASRLVAVEGERRWYLAEGPPVTGLERAAPEAGVADGPWQARCRRVDQLCDSFHRLVAMVPEGPAAQRLGCTRDAVEHSRVEARRLAAFGSELEGVNALSRGGDRTLPARIEQVRSQLQAITEMITAAIGIVAEMQLERAERTVLEQAAVATGELQTLQQSLRSFGR